MPYLKHRPLDLQGQLRRIQQRCQPLAICMIQQYLCIVQVVAHRVLACHGRVVLNVEPL